MCNIKIHTVQGNIDGVFSSNWTHEGFNYIHKTLEITRHLFHKTTNIWSGESTRLRKRTSKYNLYYFTMR